MMMMTKGFFFLENIMMIVSVHFIYASIHYPALLMSY